MVFGGVGRTMGRVGGASVTPAGSGFGVPRHARRRLPSARVRPCGVGVVGWWAHAKAPPPDVARRGRGGAASGQCR